MIQIGSRILLVILFFSCNCLLLAQEPPPPSNLWPDIPLPEKSDATSMKIIDLHLKSRGGKEALDKIVNVRFTGTINEGLIDHSLSVTCGKPDMIYKEKYRYHLGYDYTSILATDGKQAWQRVIQPEKGLPRNVGGKDAVELEFEAILPFLFSEIESAEAVFMYKGEKEIAGRKAYVLHGWLPNQIQIDVFFDARSFQIINYRHPLRIAGTEVLVDRLPTGLKKTAQVWWESGFNLQHRGKVFQTVLYDKVEANIELEDDLFTFPKIKELWLRPRK